MTDLAVFLRRLQRDLDYLHCRVDELESRGVGGLGGLAERVAAVERIPIKEFSTRLAAVEQLAGLQPTRLGLAERRERIAALNQSGLSDGMIARTLGVAASTVVRDRRTLGIPAIGVGGAANIGQHHPPGSNGNGPTP